MLSAKQKQILELVQQNPQITLAELAKAVGLKSVSTVHVHIRKLIKENFLERKGHSLISTNRAMDEFTPIPFYGFAQCGDTDIFAEENVVDYVNMPTKFLPTPTQDLFFMRAKGDSMEPSISDGDMLMFRKTTALAMNESASSLPILPGNWSQIIGTTTAKISAPSLTVRS